VCTKKFANVGSWTARPDNIVLAIDVSQRSVKEDGESHIADVTDDDVHWFTSMESATFVENHLNRTTLILMSTITAPDGSITDQIRFECRLAKRAF